MIENNILNIADDYVAKFKSLISSDLWQNILTDLTKNEIFVLWLLYRRNEVIMSDIAQYVNVPLNTATGIISRMEKKKLVIRSRSKEDKRVVTVIIGDQGKSQLEAIISQMIYYGKKIICEFSSDEIKLLNKMMDTVVKVLSEEKDKEQKKSKVRKITIE